MLPSNNSVYNRNQFEDILEDIVEYFRQPIQLNFQTRPPMQIQNHPRPTLEQEQHQFEQQRFEQNREHMQMHQRQSSPHQLNDPQRFNAPLRTGNDNSTGTSMSRYSTSLPNENVLGKRPFASNSSSEGFSLETFSGQLGVSSLASRTVPENLALVAGRSTNAPRRGRPPKNLSGTSSPKPQKSATGIPKRRGRPPKDYTALVNRTKSDSSMAKDHKTIHNNDNPPKKRGRPPKQPSPELEILAPNPTFLIYKCEWKNCPAKLHNLVTLRMHLFKIHGKRENGMTSCLWKDCTAAQTNENKDPLPSNSEHNTQYKFKDEDDWKNHVEKTHITPYAWHMGDGPQNSLDGPKKPALSAPAYLFDKNGVQVIPSIENQQIEGGDPKWNNTHRFTREIEGLDYVLNPRYNADYSTPMQTEEYNAQEGEQILSDNQDGDDDGNADMDIDSSF
ncbi:hypothetical protein SBOR_6290 [Sclerotinia borealis F-4128]|uniref:C2H2-type domain-containing protein n=1 Tax=Sclerotinia borealis (strain F-4128) TaxID=1432307 RepID=W9CEW9_SCLBF|nr:hypothetical protein SBOR_6290 [Sclerotinia borealis F-4128]